MITSTAIGIPLRRGLAALNKRNASGWASAAASEGSMTRRARASMPRQFANCRLDSCLVGNCRLLQWRAERNRDVERGHAPRRRVKQIEALLDDQRGEIGRSAA